MFYYQFNIADYASATAHLSNSEDLAYRRLLDLYYDQEKPLPIDTKWIARRIRISLIDVETVLTEFFILTDSGYLHHRCEAELEKYRRRAEANKINGLKGGRKPSRNPIGTQSEPSGLPIGTQGLPSENPELRQLITNNQITNKPENNTDSTSNKLDTGSTDVDVKPLRRRKTDQIPFDDIAHVYNDVCGPIGRPAVVRITDKRKKAISKIWRESEKARCLDWWRDYFRLAMSVTWMRDGFVKPDGSTWAGADFDYLLQDKTLTKLIEGNV